MFCYTGPRTGARVSLSCHTFYTHAVRLQLWTKKPLFWRNSLRRLNDEWRAVAPLCGETSCVDRKDLGSISNRKETNFSFFSHSHSLTRILFHSLHFPSPYQAYLHSSSLGISGTPFVRKYIQLNLEAKLMSGATFSTPVFFHSRVFSAPVCRNIWYSYDGNNIKHARQRPRPAGTGQVG